MRTYHTRFIVADTCSRILSGVIPIARTLVTDIVHCVIRPQAFLREQQTAFVLRQTAWCFQGQ